MKIPAAIILCGLFVIGGTTELHVQSSMESKLGNGSLISEEVLQLLHHNAQQLPQLTVQLKNPGGNVFSTGVVVSHFVILVTGSSIWNYEGQPNCGGVQVIFNGMAHSLSDCISSYQVTGNPYEDPGNRFYDDMAIAVVHLGNFEPRIRLLENAFWVVDGVNFWMGSETTVIGYNSQNKQNMLPTQITNMGQNCFDHPSVTIGANKVFCALIPEPGKLFPVDDGSPVFFRGVLVGTYSKRLHRYAKENEAIFSSYFEHFNWITEKILYYNNNPPPSACN